MIGPAGRWTLRLIETLFAALALGGVILVAKLSQGPVPLDLVTRALTRSLTDPARGVEADIDVCLLVWDRAQGRVGLRAQNVAFRFTGAADPFAQFPVLDVDLSMRALVRGVVAPARLIARMPALSLERDAAGRFALGFNQTPLPDTGAPPAPSHEPSDTPDPSATRGLSDAGLREAIAVLMTPSGREAGGPPASAYLRTLEIVGGQIQIRRAPDQGLLAQGTLDLGFNRTPAGVAIRGRVSLDGGEIGRSQVGAEILLDRATRRVDGTLTLTDVNPARLSALETALAPLSAADLAVSGVAHVAFDFDLKPVSASVDLRAAPGRLGLGGLYPEPLAVGGAEVKVRTGSGIDTLVVEKLALDLNGPSLEGRGAIDLSQGVAAPGLAVDVALRGLTLPDLKRLWPAGVAAGGRDWVVRNMSVGQIPEANAHIVWPAGLGPDAPTPPDVLTLDFTYKGLDARYLGKLPPLEQAEGAAHLTATGMEIKVASGRVGALQARDGLIALTGFEDKVSQAAIQVTLEGTMAETLRILNFDPLGYPKRFGMDPAKVGGRQTARLEVRLPLLEAVTMDDVRISMTGATKDLALDNLVGTRDLTAGDLSVTLTNAGLEASGRARLAGVPMGVVWTENFQGGRQPTRIQVKASLSDDDRVALGIPTGWRLAGPMEAKVDLAGRGPAIQGGKVILGLDQTIIDVPELDVMREGGGPAQAQFDLDLAPGRVALNNIRLEADGLALQGDVAFDAEGRLVQARLPVIKVETRSSLSLTATRVDGRYDLDIGGGRFDATGLLDFTAEPDDGQPGTPLRVRARIDKVMLADEAPEITKLDFTGVHDGLTLREATATAGLHGGGRLDFAIRPDGPKRRSLKITASDAAALLESLDVFDEGSGGALTLSGSFDDRTRDGPLTGALEIKDLRISKAPILFQLLTVASLDGALDTLKGAGILFGESNVSFRSQAGRIYLSDGLFSGPMVGLTLSGLIDQRADRLELKGALVPVYRLNAFLGNIPLIGDLIVGRKGEGIIGLDYSITGPTAQPEIGVNPLSVLAPGFLKRIFDFGDPKPPAEK